MTHTHHTRGKGSHLPLRQGSFWYSSSKIAHRKLSALKLHASFEPFGWRNCGQEAPIKMAPGMFGLQICTYFSQSSVTWFIISANCGSLLSSTRFSQVISRIQRKGLGGQAFRSRAAPPGERHWQEGIRSAWASFLDIYFPRKVTILQRKWRNNHEKNVAIFSRSISFKS